MKRCHIGFLQPWSATQVVVRPYMHGVCRRNYANAVGDRVPPHSNRAGGVAIHFPKVELSLLIPLPS